MHRQSPKNPITNTFRDIVNQGKDLPPVLKFVFLIIALIALVLILRETVGTLALSILFALAVVGLLVWLVESRHPQPQIGGRNESVGRPQSESQAEADPEPRSQETPYGRVLAQARIRPYKTHQNDQKYQIGLTSDEMTKRWKQQVMPELQRPFARFGYERVVELEQVLQGRKASAASVYSRDEAVKVIQRSAYRPRTKTKQLQSTEAKEIVELLVEKKLLVEVDPRRVALSPDWDVHELAAWWHYLKSLGVRPDPLSYVSPHWNLVRIYYCLIGEQQCADIEVADLMKSDELEALITALDVVGAGTNVDPALTALLCMQAAKHLRDNLPPSPTDSMGTGT